MTSPQTHPDARQPDPESSPPAARAAAETPSRLVFTLAAAGLLARLLLVIASDGSNDVHLFTTFARHLLDHGMASLLADESDFNHPPLTAAYAAAVLRLADATGIRFSILFKLPLVAADAGTILLLWKLWHRRRGPRIAATVALLFSWSLVSILVTGYHCNTDSLYSFLALLAAFLADQRQRHFAAGLALAAAVNVKLIPVLLVPAFLAAAPRRADALRFLAGLSLGALPFLAMLLLYGHIFYERVIDYTPRLGNWGIAFFLREGLQIPPIADAADIVMRRYRTWGKFLMFIAIALAAIDARRLRWDLFRAAAVTASLFLILTPGFGVQYTVFAVPLLFAVSPSFGAAYSLVAGIYLAAAYAHFSTGRYPWESYFSELIPRWASPIGLAAWALLIAFVARQWILTTPSRPPRPAVESPTT